MAALCRRSKVTYRELKVQRALAVGAQRGDADAVRVECGEKCVGDSCIICVSKYDSSSFWSIAVDRYQFCDGLRRVERFVLT